MVENCVICCEELSAAYTILKCGHRFCSECIMNNIALNTGTEEGSSRNKCPMCRTECCQEVLPSINITIHMNDMEDEINKLTGDFQRSEKDNILYMDKIDELHDKLHKSKEDLVHLNGALKFSDTNNAFYKKERDQLKTQLEEAYTTMVQFQEQSMASDFIANRRKNTIALMRYNTKNAANMLSGYREVHTDSALDMLQTMIRSIIYVIPTQVPTTEPLRSPPYQVPTDESCRFIPYQVPTPFTPIPPIRFSTPLPPFSANQIVNPVVNTLPESGVIEPEDDEVGQLFQDFDERDPVEDAAFEVEDVPEEVAPISDGFDDRGVSTIVGDSSRRPPSADSPASEFFPCARMLNMRLPFGLEDYLPTEEIYLPANETRILKTIANHLNGIDKEIGIDLTEWLPSRGHSIDDVLTINPCGGNYLILKSDRLDCIVGSKISELLSKFGLVKKYNNENVASQRARLKEVLDLRNDPRRTLIGRWIDAKIPHFRNLRQQQSNQAALTSPTRIVVAHPSATV